MKHILFKKDNYLHLDTVEASQFFQQVHQIMTYNLFRIYISNKAKHAVVPTKSKPKRSFTTSSPTVLLLCSQKDLLTSPCLLSVGQYHEWKTSCTAETSRCTPTCCIGHCIPPNWKKTTINLRGKKKNYLC